MSHWYEDNSHSIGKTPLVRLNRITVGEDHRQHPTPDPYSRHPIQISEWQHTHGKRSADSWEPTDTIVQVQPDIHFTKSIETDPIDSRFLLSRQNNVL